MTSPTCQPPTRRADAERNRDKILAAARAAFAESEAKVSMAEISRRAGVGMATLYRNFPNRHELLMALFANEVNALYDAATTIEGATPGVALIAWLQRFFAFIPTKRQFFAELLNGSGADPILAKERDRVYAAARSLLAPAQSSGEIRGDLTIEQILNLVSAVAFIPGDANYHQPILQTVLDGLSPHAGLA